MVDLLYESRLKIKNTSGRPGGGGTFEYFIHSPQLEGVLFFFFFFFCHS